MDKRRNRKEGGRYNSLLMFLILAAVVAAIIIILIVFANGLGAPGGGAGPGNGNGDGFGMKPRFGIIMQHSGRFPPNEFFFNGEMRGISPDYARMLVNKGYYAAAGCPGDGFIHTQDPSFSTIITTRGGLQARGDHFARSTLRNKGADSRSYICGAAGDWGNTTRRRLFTKPTSGYIKSGFTKLVCSTGNATVTADCPSTSLWDGSQVFWNAANFVNNAECLSENIPTSQQPINMDVEVPNNSELVQYVIDNPGTFSLVPPGTAQAFDNSHPNATVLTDNVKCSPAWGFLLEPQCEAEAECLTRANILVTSEDYNELCCQYRNPIYDAAFPNWVADNGITFGESAFNLCIDNRAIVDDAGGPEVSISFSQCGATFCDRPGDAACP